jgi:hypothetical protein
MTINTAIERHQFVPPELWGQDHWSTLAYIETKLVEGPYPVQFDARMRQNRRNYRVLERPNKGLLSGVPMSPEHGSRLADGTYLPWHDDWCCVQDMLAAGLFAPGYFEVGFPLKLSTRGYAATAALRKHKAEGGKFTNAGPVVLAALGSP